MDPILRMQGIVKRYPGVTALAGVDFELYPGEVHCLVGENGAGKSTLMNVLSGAVRAEGGTISIDGIPCAIDSPSSALALGIAVIHQDLRLVPDLSAAENIFLGCEPQRGKSPFVDRQQLYREASSSLRRLGEEFDVRRAVSSLSAAQQQMVEIAKAISKKARILVLDEPTAALTEIEMSNLFRVVRQLRREGVGVIYISHRLEEIFEIGDRVTVLRDGGMVATAKLDEVDLAKLIQWMVGRTLDQEFPKTTKTRGEEILRVDGLQEGLLRDVGFSVFRREIFGIAGLVGSGRSELARVIFGADPIGKGSMLFEGKPYCPRSPREAIDRGVGLLTEDRNRYGLQLQMNVRENISLASLGNLVKAGWIRRRKEVSASSEFVERLKIKTPSIETGVDALSGGNRQKVILARWLLTQSKLLIFDEPTAGVDVGVRYEIFSLIGRLAADGVGVILISSYMPELLGMCDRIAVMCEGRMTGILEREEATQESVLALATPSTEEVRRAG